MCKENLMLEAKIIFSFPVNEKISWKFFILQSLWRFRLECRDQVEISSTRSVNLQSFCPLINWTDGINYCRGAQCWHFHVVTHNSSSALLYVCVWAQTLLTLGKNSCSARTVISHTPRITHWQMQVSLYLPAGVIIRASSLYNLRRDVVWIILEEAYVPPASVFKLLLRSGGQVGPGLSGCVKWDQSRLQLWNTQL